MSCNGWYGFDEKCYQCNLQNLVWSSAKTTCFNRGASLYIPSYTRELNEMLDLCEGEVYIGYYRQVEEDISIF